MLIGKLPGLEKGKGGNKRKGKKKREGAVEVVCAHQKGPVGVNGD